MEHWQQEYITKSKDKLVKTTICSAELLAHLESNGVLSRSDKESLKAVGNIKGVIDQASMLYDIVQTRIQGYEKLTKAIFECLQTGALKILLDGFSENQISKPFIACHINLDVDKFMQLSASFMGKPCTINDICGDIPEAKLQNILQSTLNGSLYFQLFHAEGSQPKLNILKTNIPEPLDFYVPRSLSARLVLNSKVFREKSKDIFILTNIERHQLTQLVRPNKTATSEQISYVEGVRFILLCSNEDLDFIVNQFNGKNVHLIKYVQGSKQCVLEQTWGNASFIKQYMSSEITVTEDEFMMLSQDNGHKGICICDTPGMGKSVLLANLARNIATGNNDKICIFISLAKLVHTHFMTELDIAEKDNETNCSVLKSRILGHITTSSLEKEILKQIFDMENKQVDLFFDGFDEILESEVSTGEYILQTSLSDFPNSRIYVTSRPHMQQLLEKTFGVIGYKILPFDKTNQVKFLVNYWKSEIKNSDESKLQLFAQECLDTLKNNINSTERDIAGVPIQCRILAEVLKNDAKLSLRNSSFNKAGRILSSIFDMYSEFMKMRFAREQDSKLRNQLVSDHVLAALDLIVPQMTNCCKLLLDISTFPIVDTVPLLNIGILEGHQTENSTNLQFVHRTFAEFLIAQFFADLVFNKVKYVNFKPISYNVANKLTSQTYFTTTALKECQSNFNWDAPTSSYRSTKSFNINVPYPTINYFLNGHLKRIKLHNTTSLDQYITNFEKRNVYRLMIYCLTNNHSNTFEMIVQIIYKLRSKKLRFFRKYFTHLSRACMLLHSAIRFCETGTVERCFKLYRQRFKCDLRLLADFSLVGNVFPLQLAVERGHYGIVEFLIEKCKFPFKNKNLIKHCIDFDSFFPRCNNTSERIQIIKYLVKKDRSFLEKAKFTDDFHHRLCENSPLHISKFFCGGDPHVELLKCLVNEGASISTVDKEGNTFLKPKTGILKGHSLHNLVSFLSKHSDALTMFSVVNKHQCTLLHQLMERRLPDLMPQTLGLILRITNMDINVLNRDKETPLFSAVRQRQNQNVFEFLLENGSNVYKTNYAGENILDVMKRHANAIPVCVLISSGKYDNLCSNTHGNSLLHLAAMKTCPEDFDDCVRILLKRNNIQIFEKRNYFGFTPLHLALQHMNVLEDTLELIISSVGVDINSEIKSGETLLFTAMKYHSRYKYNAELVMKLIDLGADLKKKNRKGETVLHLAVRFRRKNIVLYLIKAGARAIVMEKNRRGETPLDIAEKRIYTRRENDVRQEYRKIFEILKK